MSPRPTLAHASDLIVVAPLALLIGERRTFGRPRGTVGLLSSGGAVLRQDPLWREAPVRRVFDRAPGSVHGRSVSLSDLAQHLGHAATAGLRGESVV